MTFLAGYKGGVIALFTSLATGLLGGSGQEGVGGGGAEFKDGCFVKKKVLL